MIILVSYLFGKQHGINKCLPFYFLKSGTLFETYPLSILPDPIQANTEYFKKSFRIKVPHFQKVKFTEFGALQYDF